MTVNQALFIQFAGISVAEIFHILDFTFIAYEMF